jgi:predicted dehydrogenase/threonine dehydrogenase-like Zn-dependent dehydrogenase
MKQLIQSFKTGKTILEEVPAPQLKKGAVLIQTTRSLVSLGTERMLVEFGKANLIQKARQQPDKVKQVLEKIQTDGLMPTLETVFNKLDQPLPLGYCNVGKVIAVGEGVSDIKIGDRVASNGNHAELVCVPQNLVAKIPDAVTDDEAVFTVIGAIGLQGIRLLNPTFGETIVVIGLGLIGLLTAELLLANGCRVIGFDVDEDKVSLAKEKGLEAFSVANGIDSVKLVMSLTNQIGTDGVIITASSKSNELIAQAAQMSRKRGRIILVGVIGLDLKRADFYEKELTFQVSCSYGPGRYDDAYEQKGIDYPLSYVRWTEKRNFETVLFSIASGKLNVQSLITERVALEDYHQIYDAIGATKSIASLLIYPEKIAHDKTLRITSNSFAKTNAVMGIVGAGNFTKMTLLPTLDSLKADIKYIASANGLNSTLLAKKHKISFSTSDYTEILKDQEVDLVVITTRHNHHAKMTIAALEAKKHVFVEKPLALTNDELDAIIRTYQQQDKTLTVGFNRRFSPHALKMKALLGTSQMNVVATMNAGYIPPNSWVHDSEIGGGRIIGEACHFIDLITFLTGSSVTQVCMNTMGSNPTEDTDNASILLKYENGSTGVINYFANGSKAYSKERVEVYSQGRVLVLDNFKKLEGFGFKGFSTLKTGLDKGHKEQFRQLITLLKQGGGSLIPFEELINTSRASFAAIQSMKENRWIQI